MAITEDAQPGGPTAGNGADQASQLNTRYGAPVNQRSGRRGNFLTDLYGSAVGKKYAMAITGVIMMIYVVAHMVGNLKMYLGAADLDEYAEFLRDIAYPLLPHSGFLWIFRVVLLAALIIHVHAAYALTRMNRRSNAGGYRSKRDYVAADFAGRTMRWTGVIVLLFIGFHLLDLTFGTANPDFETGAVYNNVVASFERVPVSIFYIVANLALGFHLYHGGWSLFQSIGWNNARFNLWRRWFAVAFAVIVVAGNISFPVAVLAGVVD